MHKPLEEVLLSYGREVAKIIDDDNEDPRDRFALQEELNAAKSDALQSIKKIIEIDIVGENETISRSDGEPDDEAYLARFSRAVGRNGLRNKQRSVLTNALYGEGVKKKSKVKKPNIKKRLKNET